MFCISFSPEMIWSLSMIFLCFRCFSSSHCRELGGNTQVQLFSLFSHFTCSFYLSIFYFVLPTVLLMSNQSKIVLRKLNKNIRYLKFSRKDNTVCSLPRYWGIAYEALERQKEGRGIFTRARLGSFSRRSFSIHCRNQAGEAIKTC